MKRKKVDIRAQRLEELLFHPDAFIRGLAEAHRAWRAVALVAERNPKAQTA